MPEQLSRGPWRLVIAQFARESDLAQLLYKERAGRLEHAIDALAERAAVEVGFALLAEQV